MREEDSQTAMAEPQDTEITLGTGKMLVLFFGLVALCSAFFALGFKLGKSSGGSVELTTPPSNTATTGGVRPSTRPATTPSQDVYKAVGQAPATAQPPAADATAKPADTALPAPTAPAAADAPNLSGSSYFVQVAAVTKQEDADALVDALKKKSYAAFSSTQADKFIHVQVGPFTDIKEAEATRAKLVGDGYNPILKK